LAEDIKDMPDWMYKEPGEKGSSKLHFALINVSTNPTKNGLRQTPPVGMDCFSGAGLFSVGLEESRLNVKFAVEKEIVPVQSYANIHNAEVVSKLSSIDEEWSVKLKTNDGKLVFHCTMKEFLSKCEEDLIFKEALGRCDFVVLSPPCQGFSKMNIYKEGNALENNEESLRILKVAELLSPKILLFENVFGLWERDHINRYLRPIVYGLINMNYSVQVGKICAADYGDPQTRNRIYLIASRSCVGVPVFLKPTHSSPNKLGGSGETTPYITTRDVLRGEEDNFPETENHVMDEKLVTFPNKPVPTVLASKSHRHYCKNRRYSLIENALLMGQERDFVSKLRGDAKLKQRQIGNGVPMGMAKAMGRAIHEVLKWEWEGEDD
jgi:site-specific DNA-cytosine methylase